MVENHAMDDTKDMRNVMLGRAQVQLSITIQCSLLTLTTFLLTFIFNSHFKRKLIAVDCLWGDWTKWSKCSASCGDGKRKYVRRIKTRAKHGGKKCVGNANKTEPCNVAPCPGNLHYPKR